MFKKLYTYTDKLHIIGKVDHKHFLYIDARLASLLAGDKPVLRVLALPLHVTGFVGAQADHHAHRWE